MNAHEQYMQRCLQLAALGIGHVSPNPLVGALVVFNHTIIGEGHHRQFGGAHAEVNAIQSVNDHSLLPLSTLYVNLEPCAHYGKTPPCSTFILGHQLQQVVIGMTDPFAAVNGAGIRQLREGNIHVITGVLEPECRQLNKRFIKLVTEQRPYITLKWATTPDGFAGRRGERIQISNQFTGILAHQLRHSEQAILVGAGTVLSDDPALTTRNVAGRNPIRVIADPRGRLINQNHFQVFDGSQPTIIFTGIPGAVYPNAETIPLSEKEPLAETILRELGSRQIDSVLVEGGPYLQQEFLRSGRWDECYIFRSETALGHGLPAPAIPEGIRTETPAGNNTLIHLKNAA